MRCACCAVLSWLSRSADSLLGRPACPAPPLPRHSMLGTALRPRPETSTGLPTAVAYPAHEPLAHLCPAAQVGRVRTEETILRSVDHPYLAKLYATIQTGAPWCWGRAKHARLLGACIQGGPSAALVVGPGSVPTLEAIALTALLQNHPKLSLCCAVASTQVQRPTFTSCWSTALAACCTMYWSGVCSRVACTGSVVVPALVRQRHCRCAPACMLLPCCIPRVGWGTCSVACAARRRSCRLTSCPCQPLPGLPPPPAHAGPPTTAFPRRRQRALPQRCCWRCNICTSKALSTGGLVVCVASMDGRYSRPQHFSTTCSAHATC